MQQVLSTRATALTLALVVTLATLAGMNGLAQHEYSQALLAQSSASTVVGTAA